MKSILFLGDSITDCERLYSADGLGLGYVKIISERLPYAIVNRGCNGFGVYDVRRLLKRELEIKPDIVCVLVGVNDIPSLMAGGETFDDFGRAYEDILKRLAGYRTVAAAPFLFRSPSELISRRPFLENMTEIIVGLCERYGVPCIPTNDIFEKKAEVCGEDKLTVDGIHLTYEGHRILADEFIRLIDHVAE